MSSQLFFKTPLPIVLSLLVISCGPSESFPVAAFNLECPSMKGLQLSNDLQAFADQEGLTVDLQENSDDYVRLRIDGTGYGHQIYMSFWASDGDKAEWRCAEHKRFPCLDVTAFSGGVMHEEQLGDNAKAQSQIVERLKQRFEGRCTLFDRMT